MENIPATLSLVEASARSWDVLIVGAGPAGAFTAHELAQHGRNVLLVDKAAFPRWKVCGSCLNGRSLAVLAARGLGDLPARLGGLPLHDACVSAGHRRARLPLPAGMSVSRQAFDAGLVRAAIDAGAQFLPETQASLGPSEERFRLANLRQRHACTQISTQLVVAADGLGGGLMGGRPAPRGTRTMRIGSGVLIDANGAYEPGTIHLACGPGGYVGVVRVEGDRLDLAACLDPAWLRAVGGPGLAARSLLQQAALPCPALLEKAPWQGTRPLNQQPTRRAARRLFVIGDAAGYVEPFTGEGIAWALESALAVAPLVERGIDDWQPDLERRWTSRHRRLVGQRQRLCWLLTRLLRSPLLTSGLVRALARWPSLARPVVNALNGA